MLGNGRVEAMCFDGEKRLAHIRGKMRKKVWINQGDIILLSLRDFQDDKADVIQKYTVSFSAPEFPNIMLRLQKTELLSLNSLMRRVT